MGNRGLDDRDVVEEKSGVVGESAVVDEGLVMKKLSEAQKDVVQRLLVNLVGK